MGKWDRYLNLPDLPLGEDGERVTACKAHIELSRRTAAEGAVLLKNDGTLPLEDGVRLAVFGKGLADYVKGGGGSGDVTAPYVRGLLDALSSLPSVTVDEGLAAYYRDYVAGQYGEGGKPGLIAEPGFPYALALKARSSTDTALIAISRFSGENWDRVSEFSPLFSSYNWTQEVVLKEASLFERGDFYLSKAEREMAEQVLSLFDKVIVVLNTGGVVDVSWIAGDDRVRACLQAFQGGMEGGSAIADILTGSVNPSGRLTDTYAHTLEDYPSTVSFHESLDYVEYQEDIFTGYRYFDTIPGASEKVVYPFGFGLSYTSFSLDASAASFHDGSVSLEVKVTNTGGRPGRDVIEVYVSFPEGKIEKPRKALAAFAKTESIEPGSHETVFLSFPLSDVACFDDGGTLREASWVLERGGYDILLSDDAVTYRTVLHIDLPEDIVIEEVTHKLRPTSLSRKLHRDGTYESLECSEAMHLEPCFPRQPSYTLEGVGAEGHERGCGRSDFSLVAEGKETLDDFIGKLSADDLIDLLSGQPNTGIANTFGFGNQEENGIPNVMTADGPAGLRIKPERGVSATAWPVATLLASTWDVKAVEEVGRAGGAEVKENNIGIWLTPAVNIHRNPMCGRNFEYYSEDPLLSGKTGAAMVRGIQSNGIGACVKHFALNNKETNRKDSTSIASERTIREIYLRPFEIIVKEARPLCLMSSYNIVNGIRASENKELLTDILRSEWGFDGFVTTDWRTHGEHYLECIAGSNLKMPRGYPERVKEALDRGFISVEDIRLSAKRILSVILKL